MSTVVARIEAEGIEDGAFEVAEVTAKERISHPYEFTIRLIGAAGKTLDEEAVLDAPARLVLEVDGQRVRAVHGLIHRIENGLHSESGQLEWSLVLVPRLQALALTTTTEISIDEDIMEVVESRLKRGALASRDYKLSVNATYPKREFIVQFKETDLAFVNRLTEQAGISYFFRQEDENEVVVFVDDNASFRTEADGLKVPFRPRGERADLFELRAVSTATSSKVRVKDYNYRTPAVALKEDAETQGKSGETYEYGVHTKTPEEAKRLAKVRGEELAWQRRIFHGKTARPELSPGTKFTLEGHPMGDFGQY